MTYPQPREQSEFCANPKCPLHKVTALHGAGDIVLRSDSGSTRRVYRVKLVTLWGLEFWCSDCVETTISEE